MPQQSEIDQKICPKCTDKMNRLPVEGTLPHHKGGDAHIAGDLRPVISLSEVWPVEIYCCPNCRFLELYAA
jgi:Zn-finger nucleic acid-binding protein